jgi:ketosteroid isomerase-like protein
MWDRLVRRRYLSGIAALERADLDALLANFDPACTFVFVGRTPLGARLTSRVALRRWFERFHRLLPQPRFEIHELAITGWPWDVRLAVRAALRSTVAGEPYQNEFAQFLRLRWGRVVWDYVLEDTQRFEQACARLAAAGVGEAAAEPIAQV